MTTATGYEIRGQGQSCSSHINPAKAIHATPAKKQLRDIRKNAALLLRKSTVLLRPRKYGSALPCKLGSVTPAEFSSVTPAELSSVTLAETQLRYLGRNSAASPSQKLSSVTPAKAGGHCDAVLLGSRFRGNDEEERE